MKITATVTRRIPTEQYGFIERTFVLETETLAAELDAALTGINVSLKRAITSNGEASAPEPVVEVKAEPVVEVKAEPVVEVKAEPVVEVKAEPVVEVKAEPVVEVKAEPVVEVKATDELSLKDLNIALAKYAKDNGPAKVLAQRTAFGVSTVAELAADKRRAFLTAVLS